MIPTREHRLIIRSSQVHDNKLANQESKRRQNQHYEVPRWQLQIHHYQFKGQILARNLSRLALLQDAENLLLDRNPIGFDLDIDVDGVVLLEAILVFLVFIIVLTLDVFFLI